MFECFLQVFYGNGQVIVNILLALDSVLLPKLPPTLVSRRNVIDCPLKDYSQVRPENHIDLGVCQSKRRSRC